jgi:protein-S-isoprenylcysteine O-methyltransferase Ste14
MSSTGRDGEGIAGVVAPPPLIYAGGLAAGLVVDAALPDVPLPGALRLGLGGAGLVAGIALVAAFVRALRRASTAVRPDRPTTSIVTTGPYRLTRNPGYLGMAFLFVAGAILADAPWAIVALVPTLALVDRGVVAREERYLEQRFGSEYVAYRSRVRRWI